MKILFMGSEGTDYQSDCLLHGLYNFPGIEVFNSPRSTVMYAESFDDREKKLTNMYGRGFTIYGILPKYHHYEKEDIKEKISNNYFDYVIFSHAYLENIYHKEVFKNYDNKKIIIIDGRDSTEIKKEFFGKGIIFKRELLLDLNSTVFPISFAFPEEKIQTPLEKTRKDSEVKPDTSSKKYLYDKEQDYYDDYRQSLFGDTKKKAGWDCMRHYEIMACRAIPNFLDLENCPKNICLTLPKELLKEGKEWYGHSWDYYKTEQGYKEYHDLENKIFEHFKENCTTKALAKYVLDVMKSIQ